MCDLDVPRVDPSVGIGGLLPIVSRSLAPKLPLRLTSNMLRLGRLGQNSGSKDVVFLVASVFASALRVAVTPPAQSTLKVPRVQRSSLPVAGVLEQRMVSQRRVKCIGTRKNGIIWSFKVWSH